MKVAASPRKKEANPASLRSAAPSIGRGSRGRSLLPMEGGAPKGRRLDGESGMKKSGKDRLKYAVCESTLSTATRSPFPNGEGYDTRAPLSPKHSLSLEGKAKRRRLRRPKRKPTPPRCARSPFHRKGLRGHSLLPVEGGAPKGRRLDGDSGMKKSGKDRLKSTICESTLSTAGAVPLPQWGRLRNENTAIPEIKPSPRGEG